jgi:hypothetical protein
MVPKKSSLPSDWKKQLEKEIAELEIYEPRKRRMAAILPKKELAEAAEAVWDECRRNAKDLSVFFHDMVTLLWDANAYGSDDSQFRHMTRAGYLSIAKSLEIVKEDWCCPPEIRDENYGDERITWENINYLIDFYRNSAEESTNFKGKSERELSTLFLLMGRCRLRKIRYWVKVTSPLMRAVFGPTWTGEYTKRRASDWKINQELSRLWVAKDGQVVSRATPPEVPYSE